MKRKNIRLLPPIALDERQRQQMYQIEHRGFWFAYFGILALLLLEILTNASGILIGCTTILLLALSIYMECCCIRRGLWDWRQAQPEKQCLDEHDWRCLYLCLYAVRLHKKRLFCQFSCADVLMRPDCRLLYVYSDLCSVVCHRSHMQQTQCALRRSVRRG